MADVDLEKAVRNAVGTSAPGIVVVVMGVEGVRGWCATGFANAVSREAMRIDDTFPWVLDDQDRDGDHGAAAR